MDERSTLNIATVIDYIEDHLDHKLTLETIAAAVHYSKYHLHRLFAEIVGMTIHDYVQRRQLTEAAKLLVFSEQPIIEIALTCGYETQQSFSSACINRRQRRIGKSRAFIRCSYAWSCSKKRWRRHLPCVIFVWLKGKTFLIGWI